MLDLLQVYIPMVLGRIVLDYLQIIFTWKEDAFRDGRFRGCVSPNGSSVTNPYGCNMNAFVSNESMGSFIRTRIEFQVKCNEIRERPMFGFCFEDTLIYNYQVSGDCKLPNDLPIASCFYINIIGNELTICGERKSLIIENADQTTTFSDSILVFLIIVDKDDRIITIKILNAHGLPVFERPIIFRSLTRIDHLRPFVSLLHANATAQFISSSLDIT